MREFTGKIKTKRRHSWLRERHTCLGFRLTSKCTTPSFQPLQLVHAKFKLGSNLFHGTFCSSFFIVTRARVLSKFHSAEFTQPSTRNLIAKMKRLRLERPRIRWNVESCYFEVSSARDTTFSIISSNYIDARGSCTSRRVSDLCQKVETFGADPDTQRQKSP